MLNLFYEIIAANLPACKCLRGVRIIVRFDDCGSLRGGHVRDAISVVYSHDVIVGYLDLLCDRSGLAGCHLTDLTAVIDREKSAARRFSCDPPDIGNAALDGLAGRR